MSYPFETIREAYEDVDRVCCQYSLQAKVLHGFIPYIQLPDGLIIAPVWNGFEGLCWVVRTAEWESPVWATGSDTIESAVDDAYRNGNWQPGPEPEPPKSANDLVSEEAAAAIFAALLKTDIPGKLLITLDGATITMTAKPPVQTVSIQISTTPSKLVRARNHKCQMLKRNR